MKKLRAGVIGVGYLGKYHAQKYAGMDNVDLVGVVDTEKSRAETVARQVGTRAYTSHLDLMGRVDAVSIAVPTPAHYAVGRDFLENSVDILIEKPMTTSLEEADKLLEMAESRGLIIQVGHLEEFNPAVVAAKEFVKRPMFIESHRLSIYNDRSTDVSVVLDLMIHDIDIILNLVKSEIKEIRAAGAPVTSKQVDIANARLEFENGCVANITASRISTKNQRKIRLFQRDGYLAVDFSKREITVINQVGQKDPSDLIPGMEIKQLCFIEGDALENEIRSFVTAVSSRKLPEVTGKMGRNALKIALCIMAQIDSFTQRNLEN
ncbi:MAG: UDP-N-acetyl-D-glucosamine dehydrogenase [Desulfobacteraceae bacterium 4572_123]|nr:MAG: UDP-N-acetyl-D-glucosamine dehydrogenase [Desulfobacteraceae bacterium 4572_123]